MMEFLLYFYCGAKCWDENFQILLIFWIKKTIWRSFLWIIKGVEKGDGWRVLRIKWPKTYPILILARCFMNILLRAGLYRGARARWPNGSATQEDTFYGETQTLDKTGWGLASNLIILLIGRVFIVNFGTKTSLKNEVTISLLRRTISCIR